MKKFGFTMVELLVTLAIIATAAAILVPSFVKIKPDRYKFRVLNCYNTIVATTENLLDNPSIYYKLDYNEDGTQTEQFGCVGLECILKPLDSSGFSDDKYSQACKYPNLLKEFLQLSDATDCSNTAPNNVRVATGKTADNAYWTIDGSDMNSTYKITIDFDPAGSNCEFGESCKHPDRYSFSVNKHGDITGSDSLTRVYIKNMVNVDKAEDYRQAGQQ